MTRVGLLVFEQFDLLDVGAPYEVLLTANRLATRDGAPPPFTVDVVGLTTDPLQAYGGMAVTPTRRLAEVVDDLDVLLVPGAIDLDGALAAPALVDAVRDAAGTVPVLASVCTGAFVLGRADLLAGRAWTTHWEDVDALADEVGDGGRRARWVDDGEVVTGGGLSCGLDLGLHLVDRYAGRELAVVTARQVDHVWDPDGT